MATLNSLKQTEGGIFLAFDNGNSCCILAKQGEPARGVAEKLRELANMVMILGAEKQDVH